MSNALGLLARVVDHDLKGLLETPALAPLLRKAAARLLSERQLKVRDP